MNSKVFHFVVASMLSAATANSAMAEPDQPALEDDAAFAGALVQPEYVDQDAFAAPSPEASATELSASDFASLPEARTREGASGATQSHIQGEFVQDQGEVSEQSATIQTTPSFPESTAPVVEDAGAGGKPAVVGQRVANYDGIANSGWIPPDTHMAVGPRHIVEVVNSHFAVYNKNGTISRALTQFTAFFNAAKPTGWGGFMFDPKVVYNPWNNRFVMMVLGRDNAKKTSYFFIAFSRTSNPADGWYLYRLSANFGADSDAWCDYSTLGADPFGIYLSCNMFRFGADFKHSSIFKYDLDGFSGGTINGWRWRQLKWPNGSSAFSPRVTGTAHSQSGTNTTHFVNTFPSSGNSVLLWKMKHTTTTAEPTLSKTAIPIAAYNAIGTNVKQKGTTGCEGGNCLDGGDSRVQNAVYAQGRVFFTLTNDPKGDAKQVGFHTVKLNANNNSKEWEHVYWSNDWYYFYPALTINGGTSTNPAIGVFLSMSNGTTWYASAGYKLYQSPPGTAGSFVGYKLGLDNYVKKDMPGKNRWGDYSGAGYDWSCKGRMWGAAEYAGTDDQWSTRIAGVMMDGSPTCPL